MNILYNLFLYGYLPFLVFWVAAGIWERAKGIFDFGSRDHKDPKGTIAIVMCPIIGVIPLFNIWMAFGVLIEIPIKDYLKSRKRHEQ